MITPPLPLENLDPEHRGWISRKPDPPRYPAPGVPRCAQLPPGTHITARYPDRPPWRRPAAGKLFVWMFVHPTAPLSRVVRVPRGMT